MTQLTFKAQDLIKNTLVIYLSLSNPQFLECYPGTALTSINKSVLVCDGGNSVRQQIRYFYEKLDFL